MVDSVKVGDRVTLESAVGGARAYVTGIVTGGDGTTAPTGSTVAVQEVTGPKRNVNVADIASVDSDISFSAGDLVFYGEGVAEVLSQSSRTVRLKMPGRGGWIADAELHAVVLNNGSESAQT